ncbi:GNAT family N-acetyltransferase [Microbacterium sp. SD291]|uniref:GNAT family N-acetyltransferase n=1 Tax=Microbacterium sp. SD291 TaxID=2782007 RepID=UPI0027DE96DD|nr:GNAT family N-acetyltransferase [Microbacterium sp. SD291]
MKEPDLLTVLRKDTLDAIGYCGLVFHGTGSAGEPEIAFELLRAAHGRGHATEAATAVISWAEKSGHPRLWASVWDWNIASRRVLEKLGFQDSGRSDLLGQHGRSLITVRGGDPAHDLRKGGEKILGEDVDPAVARSTK